MSRVKVGKTQTNIRKWTEGELFARKLVINCIETAFDEAKETVLRKASICLETNEARKEFNKPLYDWNPDIANNDPDGWKAGELAMRLDKIHGELKEKERYDNDSAYWKPDTVDKAPEGWIPGEPAQLEEKRGEATKRLEGKIDHKFRLMQTNFSN